MMLDMLDVLMNFFTVLLQSCCHILMQPTAAM
jgi:hypothetical protein